jgi:SAM-dependent methyltransferase
VRRRLASAWRRHSAGEFFRLALRNIAVWLRETIRPSPPAPPDPFDALYGTDTATIREVGSLDIDSPQVRFAVRYQPSPPALVKSAIDGLGIDPADYCFIDYGSGKGRVLLLAAGYPFKEVVGIELSAEMHAVARGNIARYPPHLKRAGAVVSLCRDATEHELPASDLICYFYNPFGDPVMARVAERLAAHRAQNGHRVIVLYLEPRHRKAFEERGFRILASDRAMLVLSA